MRVSPHWGSEKGAIKSLALFVPTWHIILATAKGILYSAANNGLSHNSWYAFPMLVLSGGGNLSTDFLLRKQKRFQSTLRKFQHFTGSL